MAEIRAKYVDGCRIYSREVFPVEVMEEDYRFSKTAETAIRLMRLKCVGVRRCAAGEDNAFWKIMGIAYMEHLARPSTPSSSLQSFLISSLYDGLPSVPTTLHHLITLKQTSSAGMSWLQSQYHSQTFWSQLAAYLKRYIVQYIVQHGLYADLFPGEDTTLVELFFSQDDFEDTAMKVISEALSLKIIVFSPEPLDYKRRYMADTASQQLAVLYLFRDMAQYHILYSKEQLAVERYSLETMSIQGELGEWEKERLYSGTKSRTQLQSYLTRDISLTVERIKSLTRFSAVAQDWISSLMKSIESSDVSERFYTTDIVRYTLLHLQDYNSTLVKIRNNLQIRSKSVFVQGILEMLEHGSLEKAFQTDKIKTLFRQMKVCDYCHEPGNVILDCSHSFCTAHILPYLQQHATTNPFFLKANGETTDDLRCPLLKCFVRISGGKYREIVGSEEFERHLMFVENGTMTRCCHSCHKIRTHDYFQPICSCKQPICLYCFCTFLRRNSGFCSCGLALTTTAVDHLNSLTVACAECLKVKRVLKDFTHIECEEHLLCQMCLKSVARGNKRCTVCYRRFSQQEMSEAALVLEKTCQFCGRNCSQALLSTDCGCTICLICAKEFTVRTGEAHACFRCKRQLTEYGCNQLIAFLPTEVTQVEIECPVCLESITEDQSLKLPCDHVLCNSCFEGHIQSQLPVLLSTSYASCPIAKCTLRLNLPNLQRFLSTALYSRLTEQLEQGKTTTCPKCKAAVQDRDENDAKKSTLVCYNCGYRFCSSCNLEITSEHSPQLCQFTQMQTLVSMTEATKEVNDTVAQCPSCKYPFLHIGGCSNVLCKTSGCSTKFCVQCSALFCGFRAHGRAWHRPDCRYYQASDKRLIMSTNCVECLKAGSLCSPPKKLNTPRRFDINGN